MLRPWLMFHVFLPRGHPLQLVPEPSVPTRGKRNSCIRTSAKKASESELRVERPWGDGQQGNLRNQNAQDSQGTCVDTAPMKEAAGP